MKTITKTTLISLAVASALAIAPQAAFAHKTGKKHTHKTQTHAHKTVTTYSPEVSTSNSDARLRALEAEVQSLRGELGRNRTEDKTTVATAEQAATQAKLVENKIEEHEKQSKENHNVLSFRGGYAAMTHNRNDELLVSNNALNGLGVQNETNGGAGLVCRCRA